VTVYGPARVPLLPPPPPPPDEDPPQAFRKNKPENRTQPNRKPRYRLLREVKPAPSSASPPIGNHRAKESSVECGASDAVVTGVVFTVSTDVPVPPVTVAGANAHVGASVTTGVTAVQERVTSPVKPFSGAMVIVEVALAPALTDAGARSEPVRSKSVTGAVFTVRPTLAV
jgi:hypothetical protein